MELRNIIEGTYEIVNGIVNVDGDVHICNMKLTEIPWKFGNVSGNFYSFGSQLVTLKNCPIKVGGNFDCSDTKITSLRYCPKSVGVSFYCSENKLTSLRYCPVRIPRNFDCSDNTLKSLKYIPKYIGEAFLCGGNPIESLKDIPFDILMKIKDIHKQFPEIIKAMPIPVERYVEIEKLVKNKLENRGVSRKVSVKERLAAI